jgi:hypothetical protein
MASALTDTGTIQIDSGQMIVGYHQSFHSLSILIFFMKSRKIRSYFDGLLNFF